jgi:hypothetical protein
MINNEYGLTPKQVEFTPEEWARREGDLANIQPIHCHSTEDGSPGEEYDAFICDHIFICRHSDGGGCGRYCAGCFGGGGSNLCDSCWCERNDRCKCGDCEMPKPGCLLYEPELHSDKETS